jgi:anti-sigma B factor antagonist
VHEGDRPEPAPWPGDGDPAPRPGDAVPPPTAYARTYRTREITVVELSGEIDLGSAGHVHPHLDAAALAAQPAVVVLDLGPLEFIDCYGLSLLVRTRRRIVDRGGQLRMACTHTPTRKLLVMTGLDGLFRPVPTLEEALST